MKPHAATGRVSRYLPQMLVYLAGVCETLLAARLLARLLAARPDNPAIQVLYTLTNPPVALLRALDSGQPRFGAVLELSTLTLLLLVPLVGYLGWRLALRFAGVSQ
jgi:uncharacterized protein YggT (Ycf19 family)